ncbi:DUF1853 family protein [Aliikangiella sp. G2MR2-5]|uniref:DUF1853 family protein n=1 Tax=Aliikangiella sp. G2MR2-5 TaxID=2788943 RepID=UPI0018AB5CB1|nr:DUF1853 family protein [Aliikangiella sp. G2MR2-5]
MLNSPVTNLEEKISQVISDIDWLFNSPQLIKEEELSFTPVTTSGWLSEVQKNPEKLIQFLSTKNLKMLGTYFESLWEFCLMHSPDMTLVAQNLQVRDEKLTLGEFDFIYRDSHFARDVHLEVAVKYYLAVGDFLVDYGGKSNLNYQTKMSDWVGPNVNDRLDIKFEKLVKKQTQLSELPAGRRRLRELGIEQVKKEACLLGYLFYPEDYFSGNLKLDAPKEVNPLHFKGCWLPVDRLVKYLEQAQEWSILEKPFWLSPLRKATGTLCNSTIKSRDSIYSEVERIIFSQNRPVLIAPLEKFNDSNGETAYQSGRPTFIVPNDWRQKACDALG